MKKLNMTYAIKWYNNIMATIGYEHNTIGTDESENTENWNLRDMVAEMDYALSTYYEDGHCNAEMRNSEYPEERQYWRNETARIKRFIAKYVPYIGGMKCTVCHCSNYDGC